MWVGMLIVPCWHAFMVALMIYAIMNLNLLKHKLQHFGDYINKENASQMNEEAYQFVAKCIDKQNLIREYVQQLEALISRSVFLDFVVYSILICALLYQASTTDSNVILFINICYLLTMSMVLWLYHWHANEIGIHVSFGL